jgi:hypothetical protein
LSLVQGNAKTCSLCRRRKALSEFPRNRTRRDGHGSRCLSCGSERQRELDRGERAPRSFAPSREPEWWEIPWAAGFIEGDGCIGLKREPSGATYLRIRVEQIVAESLERLRAIFGGSLTTSGFRTSAGNEVHRWGVAGPRAESVADLIRPYLSEHKRNQLDGTVPLEDPCSTLSAGTGQT